MSKDLLVLAGSIVERGEGDEQIEAFVTHQREFEVKAFEGAVDSLSSAEPRGAGIRIIRDGRVGFSFTTDLSDEGITVAVKRARDNATFTTEDPAMVLPDPEEGPDDLPGLWEPAQADLGPETKVDFAIALEKATRGFDPRIRTVEEAGFSDVTTEVAISTSTGIAGGYTRSDAWCWTVAIAEDGDDTEVGFEFDLARGLSSLDPEDVARRAAERALGILGAKKIPSARMPIVFEPYTAGQFLGVLGGVLTGEAVQKGRSLFAGKLGESVAAAGLDLVDDGRVAGAPGAAPWDGEGLPTRRTEVIKNGILTSLLYDTPSARRDGTASTGNASRSGFKTPPGPAPSNITFVSTGESMEELLTRAGRALLVQDFHGVHSGANPVTGDFSVGATGRLLENGVPVQAVKEVTIAAPMLDILRGIVAVANDIRWLPFGGSVGGATTLVAEMTVAGL
ncbi:MAG: PmbA protein [Actinomycetota bacterium]|jgi:PmbA protein|nr:PmbA protein [Actinomycetota bacterium]